MIDTIKLTSYVYNSKNTEFKTNYEKYIYYRKEEKGYFIYKIRNLFLVLTDKKLTISGSLTKYFLNHNINMSLGSLKDVKDALKLISDDLDIDLDNFIISRLDIGRCYILTNPVSDYLTSLKILNGHHFTYHQDKGRSFSNTIRSLSFYDKVTEIESYCKKKRVREQRTLEILRLQHKNILRYELKILLPLKHFGKRIIVKDFVGGSIYNKLLDEYIEYYNRIKKDIKLDINFTNKMGKDIIKLMAVYGIEKYGVERFENKYTNLKNSNPSISRGLAKSLKGLERYKKLISKEDEKIEELTDNVITSATWASNYQSTNLLISEDVLLLKFLSDMIAKEREVNLHLEIPKLSENCDFSSVVKEDYTDLMVALVIKDKIQKIKRETQTINGSEFRTQDSGLNNAINLMKQIKRKNKTDINLVEFLNQVISSCK
jgi:hypothetical protein